MSGIAVLGAGAFGTALAVAIARDGTEVTLIARDAGRAETIARDRACESHLPGVSLPASVSVRGSPDGITATTILLCVPMQALGGVLDAHAQTLGGKTLVACCKGVDLKTGTGPTALIATAVPSARAAYLSGPSFAADIGRGLPTALTLACTDKAEGARLQEMLSTPALRLYLTGDVLGAELGGALKNVIALAAGVTIGAGLGESARASVITRGFAEIQRVAIALGAETETLHGLSGLGDLVLTCTSEKSRNYQAGLQLGAGQPLPEGTTIEGVATATAMARLTSERGLEAPLIATVAKIVSGEMSVADATAYLLARPLKDE